MKARIIILVFILLSGNTLHAHEVHMSIANIDILPDSNKIEFSLGLFYEDLQALVNHRHGTLIDFGKQISMTASEKAAILGYIDQNFIFSDGEGNAVSREFIYWKIEDEMIWLFFCTDLPDSNKPLTIKNTLFFELYTDQVNYTVIKNGTEEQGVEFNRRKTQYQFSI